MIPEAAVEAAAKRMAGAAYGIWDLVPEAKRRLYLRDAHLALEAAAPHMMRTISTVADLDALPAGSVVMGFDADGDQLVSRKSDYEGLWEQAGTDDGWQAPDIIKWYGRVTVLHEP